MLGPMLLASLPFLLLLASTAPSATSPAPTAAPPRATAASSEVLDFTAEAKLLFRVVACGDETPLPKHLDAKVVDAHCVEMQRRYGRYRETWVKQAIPFLEALTPAGLPTTVVYPFGGGDLLSALTTFPDARDLTTMSLEHAGDPRRITTLDKKQLEQSLALLRQTSSGLLTANDSKTVNLMKGQRGDLPGQLSFFLMALAVHGFEPVSLKYVKVNGDGSLRYLTKGELEATEGKTAELLHAKWVSPDFSPAFDNLELVFVKKGGDPKKEARVHRHFPQNLDDEHFGKDTAMQAYLNGKGKVVAMTKAASYLLWRGAFSTIRTWLLSHMVFMVSDSTGIPPKFAKAAGFEQEAFGSFEESFLGASPQYNEEFRALWKKARPLPFRYGYLDKRLHYHLLITRRPAAPPGGGGAPAGPAPK